MLRRSRRLLAALAIVETPAPERSCSALLCATTSAVRARLRARRARCRRSLQHIVIVIVQRCGAGGRCGADALWGMDEVARWDTAASLSQLQNPAVASVDGNITPYEDVRIHVSAEALTRALSAFEGLKAYWNDDSDELALRWPERHYERQSARARCSTSRCTSCSRSTSRGSTNWPDTWRPTERDVWFRATMCVGIEGPLGRRHACAAVIRRCRRRWTRAPPYRTGVSTRGGAPADVRCNVHQGAEPDTRSVGSPESRPIELGYDDAMYSTSMKWGGIAEQRARALLCVRQVTVLTPPALRALESSRLTQSRPCATNLGSASSPAARAVRALVAEELRSRNHHRDQSCAEIVLMGKPVDGVLAEVRRSYVDALRRRTKLPGLSYSMITRVSRAIVAASDLRGAGDVVPASSPSV